MKIGHYKQMQSFLTRPDTKTPEERKIIEDKKAKAEVERKNKKRAEYGLKPIIDPKKFVELTNTYDGNNFIVDGDGNITDEASLKKKFENEEKQSFQAKNINTEPRTLTKQVDPNTKVIPNKQIKPFVKKSSTVDIEVPNIDFTPIDMDLDAMKPDPELEILKQRIDDMQRQSKLEKLKNQNSGIGYLAGGSKVYE